MPRAIPTVIAAVTLAAAVTGCSDEDAEPVTVADYAAVACISADEPITPTWGEFAEITAKQHDQLRSQTPPPDLAEWHDANLWTLGLMLDYAEDQAPDGTFNPFELFGVALLAAGAVTEAEQSIPADVVTVLAEHGCVTDNWGEDKF